MVTLSKSQIVQSQTTDEHEDLTWNRTYLCLYVAYIVIGLVWRALAPVFGDAVVYVNAARRVLDGSFDMYSLLVIPESAPPLGGGYTYSPLVAIIMAPFVGVSDVLGWGEEWSQKAIGVPLLFIDVLAMHQMRRLIRMWKPYADERFIFLGVVLTLFLTSFWSVSAARGHHEGLILLFLILSICAISTNILLSGMYAGLALAAKHTALLELIPMGLVLLVSAVSRQQGDGAQRGNSDSPGKMRFSNSLISTVVWGLLALAVFFTFMLPAIISNSSAVYYMFVTMEPRRIIYGTGLPVWIDRIFSTLLDSSNYEHIHELLRHYADIVLVLAVGILSILGILFALRRGTPIGLTDSRLLAFVAFGAVCQIALGKWVGGHYYQFPLALVFLWDVVRTAPHSQDEVHRRSLSMRSFPWIGLGAPIAFRSVTQFEPVLLKDISLFLLFTMLAGITLYHATRSTQSTQEHQVFSSC